MTVRVLAFGIAKDIFQNAFADVDTDKVLNVGDLKTALEERYPRLKLLKSYMVAVNNAYVSDEQIILPTDEIAVIPPVSGG